MKSNDEYYFGNPLEVPGEPLKNSSSSPRPTKKRSRFPSKKLLIISIIIIVCLGGAFAAWKVFNQKDNAPVASENTAPTHSAPSASTTRIDDIPEAGDTKSYKASHPRISFTYPDNWTVTEKDSGIRVESPGFKYKNATGSEVDGNFRIYIRQQARTTDSTYIGRGVAIQASEKLTYTEPAVGQLPQTNMTYFGLDTSDHFAYFFIAGNYALQKGDTLGPDYGKEAVTYIITGGYSSADLADDMATHMVPLDVYAKTNAFKQAIDIIKSLKIL